MQSRKGAGLFVASLIDSLRLLAEDCAATMFLRDMSGIGRLNKMLVAVRNE